MKNNLPPFSPVLRRFREEKDLSQEELAALVDVSPSHISRMESDLKIPSLEMVFRLANALNIEPDELIKAMKT
ncbi:hypothetical protein CE91St38_06510 [Desulfovibrionaceae bacterium]|nr:hypothetical protein CE91St38_06510 [Desulfovibrionaceae bacterium]GKI11194.1 hypothetical protein CE91St39_06480 [Desulfovibrionaceae bacterium]